MINCFCYVRVLFLSDGVHVIQSLFLIFGPCQVHRKKNTQAFSKQTLLVQKTICLL